MRTVHPIWYRWLKIQGLAHRLGVPFSKTHCCTDRPARGKDSNVF